MMRFIQRYIDFMLLNPKADRLLFPVCILVFLLPCAILAKGIYTESKNREKEKQYSSQCAEHKGVAVRDLDNKMRCVPMLGKANND